LLVLNKEDLTLMTVDPQTLKVTGKYPAGPNPHEVIASADGKTAYISNYDTPRRDNMDANGETARDGIGASIAQITP